MEAHSSIFTWEILWAAIHGAAESDPTEGLSDNTAFFSKTGGSGGVLWLYCQEKGQ